MQLDVVSVNLVVYSVAIHYAQTSQHKLDFSMYTKPVLFTKTHLLSAVSNYIGGTTVRDTMNAILPGLSRTTWHSYKGHLREFMSNLFMFSHVRDPITRTISSYFELHRRNETDLMNNRMIGMDSFRFLLAMMKNRMDCSLANKDKLRKMRDYTIGNIYFNMHIMPQMYFLTEAANPWRPWPVNYVGNMSELRFFCVFLHLIFVFLLY